MDLQLNALWGQLAEYLPSTCQNAFYALPYVLGLWGAWKLGDLTYTLFRVFILPGKSLRKFGPKGSWALVTGASDGIGKEYALQLAKAGYNIILVSRSMTKLAAVAGEIEAESSKKGDGVQTKTFSMDFTANDDEDYEKLKRLIQNLDISILVNNVGLSHDIPTPFVLTPDDEMENIVTVNCMGTLRVTKLVAPGMMERKRGLILTMGSFGGLFPTPLLATYSGSKAFLQHWSTALSSELRPYGISVEFVLSYLVTSAMSKIRRPSLMIPNPKNFVQAALGRIGRSSGISYKNTTVPYWSHALMAWAVESFLGAMNGIVVAVNHSMHESIRKRALRKMEREKGKKAE